MAPGAPVHPPAPFQPEGLLLDVLAVSLTGVSVLSPVYDAAGELVDFDLVYLNPAAQRMTGLPEQPGGTAGTRFPEFFAKGVFAFYRRVFETGEAGRYDVNYQADGLDNYFQVAARRSDAWLIASFTDTSDQDRTPVEVALRAAQAAEQAARAEAEAQRQRLHELLMQLPGIVVAFEGPDHTWRWPTLATNSLWATARCWAGPCARPCRRWCGSSTCWHRSTRCTAPGSPTAATK